MAKLELGRRPVSLEDPQKIGAIGDQDLFMAANFGAYIVK